MASGLPAPLRNRHARRAVTVPAVAFCAATLTASAPLWVPLTAGADLLRGRRHLPSLRAPSFALGWSALETAGVAASAALWATGHGRDHDAHFTLQRWWADRLINVPHQTAGLALQAQGAAGLAPGPIIMCARHASLADALIPMWLLGQAGMRPRYVLKDSLQLDPCLDIVGNRLPNHFIDRDPSGNPTEIAALRRLSHGMGRHDACVIFPEGLVVTQATRARALQRIAARDPARLPRTSTLRVLAPVRPSGTAALLSGAPGADLVFVTHTGLESLQRLIDAPRQIPLGRPVRISINRVARQEIPGGAAFTPWLDAQWADLDHQLASSSAPGQACQGRPAG